MNRQDLDLLALFQYYSDRDDFVQIFGNLGENLWRKFKDQGGNLLALYPYLDRLEKEKLAKALQETELGYYLYYPESDISFEQFVEENL